MFGLRCERDDGVISLSVAITGCVPKVGMHITKNRHAQVIVRIEDELEVNNFADSDFDALSLAISRRTKEKYRLFLIFLFLLEKVIQN